MQRGRLPAKRQKKRRRIARETREKGNRKKLIGELRSLQHRRSCKQLPSNRKTLTSFFEIPLKFSVSFFRVFSRVSRASFAFSFGVSRANSPSATPELLQLLNSSSDDCCQQRFLIQHSRGMPLEPKPRKAVDRRTA
jgi:hypothetical protein